MKRMEKSLRRSVCLGLAVICGSLLLGGCGENYPDKAADGTAWDTEWTMLGSVLGVEEPDNGLTLSENPVVLTGSDTYYATWTLGEPTAYTNAEGDDTDLYEAELYVLVLGHDEEEECSATLDEWLALEEETYQIDSTEEVTCNGCTYTLLSYTVTSDSNPYSRGITAFGQYKTYAVTAEFTCTAGFSGDEREMLVNFLKQCHYADRS